jgi:hypothetical protein
MYGGVGGRGCEASSYPDQIVENAPNPKGGAPVLDPTLEGCHGVTRGVHSTTRNAEEPQHSTITTKAKFELDFGVN